MHTLIGNFINIVLITRSKDISIIYIVYNRSRRSLDINNKKKL